ncbi:metal dependent phosphohydrolase [Candidatus Magnetoovum chiemensis]|nr:metal dependent phosphohydrolase [Candidatus Magnetoovum chiemensis]
MRKKIQINELNIGMYVDGIDKSWFNTPFLRHQFLVKDEKQIQKLKASGITKVYIDTEKSSADSLKTNDNEDERTAR